MVVKALNVLLPFVDTLVFELIALVFTVDVRILVFMLLLGMLLCKSVTVCSEF